MTEAQSHDAADAAGHDADRSPYHPWGFLFLPLGLLLFILQPAHGEDGAALVRHEATADLMGCTFGVAAYGSDQDALHAAVETALDEARAIDGWLSNYRPDSELSRLNRSGAAAPVVVSDELFGLLSKAMEYSRATEGAFDITVGPLVRAWGFFDGDGHVPEAGELSRAREVVGYQLVKLDPSRKTVQFTRSGVELDPGGIGKGYAVDRMVDVLRRARIRSALVNACHSSLYALGSPLDSSQGWRVEIDNPGGGASEVFLKDQSLSTSGSKEKFFVAEERVYSHILDPRTGRPSEGILAVSVIATTAIESEVWSTAIFVNGLDSAFTRAPEGMGVYGCPSGGSCRWIRTSF